MYVIKAGKKLLPIGLWFSHPNSISVDYFSVSDAILGSNMLTKETKSLSYQELPTFLRSSHLSDRNRWPWYC